MVRTVLILLLAIVLISVLRGIIGIVGKAIASFSDVSAPARRAAGPLEKADELKRDPVCGTYVPSATALKKVIGSETVYFCSETCADKYRKA